MKAVIMAGGKGTRLVEITKDEIPKPMAKLCNKPILQRTIENLKKYGVDEIYITVGHLHEKIEGYFKDGSEFGVKINYIVESQPLGSAGALYFLKDKIKGDFIVCSGDTLFDIDINAMLNFHKQNKADATLLTRASNHPFDSDLIISDNNNKILGFDKKTNIRNYYYHNLANAGFFILNENCLQYFQELKKVNMEHDFITELINSGKNVYSYYSSEYIRDVGTPERFEKATQDLLNGKINARNFKNKQKAIFIDRDGVINKYKGFINKQEDLQIFDFVYQAVKKINESEYLAIIVSNQPVLARGECSEQELDEIFKKMETLLGLKGVYFDAIYYCPHHPHKGYEGEVPELKIECDCRKPKIGMLLKAKEKFNLDFDKCWIIGDTNLDIETGNNAKIKTIRVMSGKQEEHQIKSDYVAENLLKAVEIIL